MPKRLLHIALLSIVCFAMLGAGAPSTRFDALGHKLVCPCGCGEILLECNHVGCPDSDQMISELRTELSTGVPDSAVLNWFVVKYGPTVLAAPLRGGFDIVAWIVPFAVLFLGIAGVVLVLRLWRTRQSRNALIAPAPLDPALRERIRRETGYDSQ
ncbi:MAG TPA: cytochrome c-type biogenesis protein CcmH [Acidobacteriaceae bacterium]|jgi:cytochrome c-type biogenesis protein CcmH|nr:cytochrome c-type biogenesis protein CcmH [Acidobacteriaceae bacterium]